MINFFDMLIKKGIANHFSIPQVEDNGYHVACDTLTNWIVHTPQGKHIVFKRYKGLCNWMPYVYVQTLKDQLSLINIYEHLTKNIETARKNSEGWTKRKI